jgi:hypothetical protein
MSAPQIVHVKDIDWQKHARGQSIIRPQAPVDDDVMATIAGAKPKSNAMPKRGRQPQRGPSDAPTLSCSTSVTASKECMGLTPAAERMQQLECFEPLDSFHVS